MDARRIRVSGTVQGVGFRPFVFHLAARLGVRGWVCNTSGSVEIVAEGGWPALEDFTTRLRTEAPPLARVDSLAWESIAPSGFAAFEIRASIPQPGEFQPVAPDIALCDDCARELLDPRDRRYLYPFINCTNCGPRLTIIRDVPYDRKLTSMAPFAMCPLCREEYENPNDRRFHAQPIACPACGPRVWLETGTIQSLRQNSNDGLVGARRASPLPTDNPNAPLLAVRRFLREGRIVAIRGMGGFHLACDATNTEAVRELRRRKHRIAKPFAVMVRDLAAAESLGEIGGEERTLLTGSEKPIVILRRCAARPRARPRACPRARPREAGEAGEADEAEGCPIVDEVAPANGTLGVMLPYSPLHRLLLHSGDPVLDAEPAPAALVMTSGNLSEEPIAIGNEEALARLGPLADAFLLHDREIIQRCDDSVIRVVGAQGSVPLRRSRGYAPAPVILPRPGPPILAVGGELKNAFCLARDSYAFLSPHIGDMENAETFEAFEQSVERFQRLFHTEPEIIAHDLHPGYLGTRWACEHAGGRRLEAVQHHHAHAAACMADNNLPGERPVIALAFDGTGFGEDGATWGAEILAADYLRYERMLHLEYLPLPGGDAAIRRPWRIAVGFTSVFDLPVDDLPFLRGLDSREVEVVRTQADHHLNAPPVSSMGRLFDAVAALAGVPSFSDGQRAEIDYEAQGAIELEELSRGRIGEREEYPFRIEGENIRVGELLAAVVRDVRAGLPAAVVGARFHRTVRSIAVGAAQAVRDQRGIREVVLSGGVWQNALLLQITAASLRGAGFEVYTHHRVPANDGGLALGQAVVASARSNHVSGNSR